MINLPENATDPLSCLPPPVSPLSIPPPSSMMQENSLSQTYDFSQINQIQTLQPQIILPKRQVVILTPPPDANDSAQKDPFAANQGKKRSSGINGRHSHRHHKHHRKHRHHRKGSKTDSVGLILNSAELCASTPNYKPGVYDDDYDDSYDDDDDDDNNDNELLFVQSMSNIFMDKKKKKRSGTRTATKNENGGPSLIHNPSARNPNEIGRRRTNRNKSQKLLCMSLNNFEPSSSDDDSFDDYTGDNSQVAGLYVALEISEEDRIHLRNLNTAIFQDSAEWIPSDDPSKPDYPMAASFNQLILKLTLPDSANVDFQKEFITTFPSFATPQHFMAALFTRYFSDIKRPNSNLKTLGEQKQTRDRVIRILSTWMKIAAYQFTDSMLDAIMEFTEKLMNDKNSALQAQILQASVDHLKGIKRKSTYTARQPPPRSILPEKIPEKDWTMMMINPIEIARQVTLVHNLIFRAILPTELLTVIWGAKRGGGSEHVEELTKHFDLFSRYVQFSIIEGETPKKRAEKFCFWADVAEAFNDIRNYHGVFAVMCGLTHRSIQRMTETFKYVLKNMSKKKRKIYEELVNLCDFSGDFANYRPVIRAALEPCIPFIGCFQKDLIYVQEGFPNKINGLFNFKKCSACISLIKCVEKFQNERYDFIENRRIAEIVTTFPELPDTTGMMKLSIEKEKKK